MANSRHFDTVAFDVRDNAAMLFFADTDSSGDIKSYLLLMRASGESETWVVKPAAVPSKVRSSSFWTRTGSPRMILGRWKRRSPAWRI